MATEEQQIARRFAALAPAARREFLAQLADLGMSFAELPIMPTRRQGPLPLSYAQRSLWLTWQLDPTSPAYNLPGLLHLRGPLEPSALESALEDLAQRHEILRTSFPARDAGEPEQRIHPAWQGKLTVIDVSEPSTLSRLQAEFACTPPALDTDGPLRATLWRLRDEQHVLGLLVHHIAADGGSIGILIDELLALYVARIEQRLHTLEALPIQYADYAVWQRHWLEAGERQRQLDHWMQRLGAEHAPLDLPLDHPRSGGREAREARHTWQLDPTVSAALRALARNQSSSLFMLVLTLLELVLHRFTGQTDLRIGAPVAQRRPETLGLIGYFTNLQVLRTRVPSGARFSDFFATVRATVLEAQAHADLPFDLLVEALQPQRQAGIHPLFQVKCTQQEALPAPRNVAGLEVRIEECPSGRAHFDLSLDFIDAKSGIQLMLAYDASLFEAATIERLAQQLDNFALQVIENPQIPLTRLQLIGPVSELHGHKIPWPHADVLDLWTQAVARAPQDVAIRDESSSFTHAELDRHVRRLAAQLIALGLGPEARVGILAERSCEFVLGVLAVLQAGGVYVPLDPKLPAERLAYQLEDSQAQLLLASHAPRWSVPCPQLELVFALANDATTSDALARPRHPAQAAYVIYTSGSTGRPKGVVVSRGALANYVQAVLTAIELPERACSMAMVSTVAADLGHTTFFGALCNGGTLHLIGTERAFDPDAFGEYLTEHAVDVLKIVPSHFQALLQGAAPAKSLPRSVLILGGEATHWSLLERIRGLQSSCRVLNHYGPTETTVGVLTQWEATANRAAATFPLGRPLANVRVIVLDADLNPVPCGVAGDLYIGGASVARGYQAQPARTAERFIPDPAGSGTRMYRTGDRVRQGVDGSLEFLGRLDDQVKVRGWRIELGEVRTALLAQPSLSEAEVIAQEIEGRLQLHAYIVAPAALTTEQLRLDLAAVLPDYIVPTFITRLDAMPLTANGKLDRKALPAATTTVQEFAPPIGPIEETLARVWRDVLKLERIGRHDNFLELGGDSILSLQIAARARKHGITLAPRHMMELQTIARIGAEAVPRQPTAAVAPLASEDIPLTPVQRWFFEQPFSERHHWNQSVLLVVPPSLDVARLRNAVQRLAERHDALRLSFEKTATGWRQRYHGAASQGWRVSHIDLSGAADLALAIEEAADLLQRGLRLDVGPLFEVAWLDAGASRPGRLLLVGHHLIVDAVSWRLIIEELQCAYEGGELLAPAMSFGQWAQQLKRYADSAAPRQELPYWQAAAQGDAPWPVADASVPNVVGSLRQVSFELDPQQTAQLLGPCARAHRAQVNELLLSCLASCLCEWTGLDSVRIELEGHGREPLSEHMDLSRTLGWFTTLYPVRLTPAENPRETLRSVKEELRAIPNHGFGYGVLRYLSEQGSVLAQAQPYLTFNYLGRVDAPVENGWQLAAEARGRERSVASPRRAWFDVVVKVQDSRLSVTWHYCEGLHTHAQVAALVARYAARLRDLIDHIASSAATGLSPSDVPLAKLTRAQLDALPLDARQVEDLYPLSPMQQGMLFHSLLERDDVYLNQLRLDIDGLDVARFHAAWQAVIARHAVLRTGFLHQIAPPLQWVAGQVELPFQEVDFTDEPDASRALDALAAAERRSGVALTTPPLMRIALARLGAGRYHFIWTRHHLLLDGWSTSRLLSEVLSEYVGTPLPATRGSFRDYIAWLGERNREASEAYWRSQLANTVAPTHLADALPAPDRKRQGQASHAVALDTELTERLVETAKREHVTLSTLVQAAWSLLLARYTGQEVVVFGATVAGRPAELADAEHVLGLFINTLPVIVAVPPATLVGDWLRALQRQNVTAREHEHTPLYEIQHWANRSGAQPLFDSIVVFENYPVDAVLRDTSRTGLRFGDVHTREDTNYAMTLTVQQGDRLHLTYGYARDRFGDLDVEQLATHLEAILRQLVTQAGGVLGEIALLSDTERRQLRDWGRGAPPARADLVPHAFEQQVRERPDHIALLFEDTVLSYAALDRRVNALARRLYAHGVRPEWKVGVAVPRSIEMIVAVLAILKTGAAYVPLDPEYPADRLCHMIDDSGVTLLLVHSEQQMAYPESLATMTLHPGEETELPAPAVAIHPEQLAYVIYTSGSTGKPKGVAVTHGVLATHARISAAFFGLTAADRMLLFATLSFDAFIEQLFAPLVAGASLVLRGPTLWDSQTFHREILSKRITTVDLTTAYWQILVEDFATRGVRDYGVLRQLHVGGEALPPASLQTWRKAGLGPVKLLNTYGPTEAAVTATTLDCGPYVNAAMPLPIHMPIGRPLPARSLHVLDAALHPVPVNVTGELYIGGDLLARGYLDAPLLTAERFIADPFAGSGGRLYRTGDRVRWNRDGQLEFLGRTDHQIKIRGFRVEPGEIEAALRSLPDVRDAVVVVSKVGDDARLVAYVAADGSVQASDLVARLGQRLPEYMQPSAVVVLPALPLSPNGKIDRRALPDPGFARNDVGEPPRGEIETALAELWQAVLAIPNVSRDDCFFDLGGHSLTALQVQAKTTERWQAQPALRSYFERRSLASIAAEISELEAREHGDAPAELDEMAALLDSLES